MPAAIAIVQTQYGPLGLTKWCDFRCALFRLHPGFSIAATLYLLGFYSLFTIFLVFERKRKIAQSVLDADCVLKLCQVTLRRPDVCKVVQLLPRCFVCDMDVFPSNLL